MTTPNPVERVRDRLDGGKRWIKGMGEDPAGSVCLLGAMNGHGAMPPIAEVIREQFPDRILRSSGGYIATVVTFNDHTDTTWADVDMVLEKAALR